jgi:hypothetical protein
MPRRKRKLRETEPVHRKRNEFTRALSAAKKALTAKTRERDRALNLLRDLNLDIPNLERTVRALEAQLRPSDPLHREPKEVFTKHDKQVSGVPPTQPNSAEHARMLELENIPPEIRAQLPPEDFSKFGSHYGTEAAQEEDTLPEITGKPLIPETK